MRWWWAPPCCLLGCDLQGRRGPSVRPHWWGRPWHIRRCKWTFTEAHNGHGQQPKETKCNAQQRDGTTIVPLKTLLPGPAQLILYTPWHPLAQTSCKLVNQEKRPTPYIYMYSRQQEFALLLCLLKRICHRRDTTSTEKIGIDVSRGQ